MQEIDFTDVTEVAGEEISREQLDRLCNRYYWASQFVGDKDVIEVACGTGPGLGYLEQFVKSLRSGDFSKTMVEHVTRHYGKRICCEQFDAQKMPFADNSADVIIIFEALYYIPSAVSFVKECKRILRPGGRVLVSNANPDLFDFNPSPHSFTYHGVTGLTELFNENGFTTNFFGGTPLEKISPKQRMLRPIKKLVVDLGLMPKSMAGKRWLKRLVFGAPVLMPEEITAGMAEKQMPTKIDPGKPNPNFKVIYCEARLPQ